MVYILPTYPFLLGSMISLVGKTSALVSRSQCPSARHSHGVRMLRLMSQSTTSVSEIIQFQAEEEMTKLADLYRNNPRKNAPILMTSRDEASTFVRENIDAALFDCDGVLYRTPDPIPGAKECIESMMQQGKKVLFVTNNAGVNRQELREKLSKVLNVQGLTDDEMVSASYSAAQYLVEKLHNKEMAGNRVHVIGSQGLCDELASFGFDITGGPTSMEAEMDRQELADYDFPESPVHAIVVGHDVAFTFRKLSIANVLLQKNPSALFVATNRDSFDLVGKDGRHIPGNGSIVAALEYCSRRTAVNTGKPSPNLLGVIQREHNLDVKRTMFVGDRLDTDIKFGKDTGMASVLVMTGVTTAASLAELGDGNDEEPLPNIIVSHVGKLA